MSIRDDKINDGDIGDGCLGFIFASVLIVGSLMLILTLL